MVTYNPSESEEKTLGVGELCTQNFIVYDQTGNPVSGGWTVYVTVTDPNTDTFIEEKTCVVGLDGRCSILLNPDTHIQCYARTNGEQSTGLSSPACFSDLIDLWQLVGCDTPTPNHASGCELLLHWDKDNDGVLSKDEMIDAILAFLDCDMGGPCPDPIVASENALIIDCYNDFAGVISDMCPGCEYPAHDTALTIDIVDGAGNPITTAFVGDTVYLSGQLSDVVTGERLTGATIKLYRNGANTGLTDVTNNSGVYSIPYEVISGDVPTVKFKTVFGGA